MSSPETDPLAELDVAEVAHAPGCPSATHRVAEGRRVERFVLPDTHGRDVEVIRCVDCGQQVERPVEEVVE